MTDIPVITDNDAWLDLADGQEAILQARLDTVLRDGSMIFSFADWSNLHVVLEGDSPFRETGLDRLRTECLSQRIAICVTRSEDGLSVMADALIGAEILS